jgi:hypothetical protein
MGFKEPLPHRHLCPYPQSLDRFGRGCKRTQVFDQFHFEVLCFVCLIITSLYQKCLLSRISFYLLRSIFVLHQVFLNFALESTEYLQFDKNACLGGSGVRKDQIEPESAR